MTEKTTKIGQEMTDFMPNVDFLIRTINKDAPLPKTTKKNILKLPASLMDDDPTSQDEWHCFLQLSSTLFTLQFHSLQLVQKSIGIEDVPMTSNIAREGQILTNFFLDNDHSECNKITMFSDAPFDSAPMPSLPNTALCINTNIKNASMDRNISRDGQKMTGFIADDYPPNQDNNTLLSQEPLDIDMDDQSMLDPSHMKRAHSTQSTKKQIDIRIFGKDLKGQLNDKKAAPAKQCIPYMTINDNISGKKHSHT
jgi:hypothetical protein